MEPGKLSKRAAELGKRLGKEPPTVPATPSQATTPAASALKTTAPIGGVRPTPRGAPPPQPVLTPHMPSGTRATTSAPTPLPPSKTTAGRPASAPVPGSAPLPSGTLGTALHHAAEQTKDTGGVGVELGREIEAMQARIDSRFVKIFSVMDRAVGHIVDNKAYAPGPDGESVVPLNDPNFKEQLKATIAAANGFAEIVKVLPQEVMGLTVELRDTERNFLAKLRRESSPPRTVPPTVPPFDPAVAPTSVATSAIKLSQIDIGKEPPLDVGKREAGRALGGALTTLEAIENLKARIDAQIILILNTINEVMSRALNGEAYTDAGGEISAVTDDPNPINRLETTVRIASDLIEVLERLPKEVTTLVSEIHDAEKRIVDAFDVYQAKPSQ